jgi:hypothetical protein
MNHERGTEQSFSIFDSAIRLDHREFYERVIGELNGIFPVCNQGKSMAVDISENATEQEQITELMKRVENFSMELLDVTKRLFDQYYAAKEALQHSIMLTIAYNKINTLDRNLLERTCDVRWWALETAFSDCIRCYAQTREKSADFLALVEGSPAFRTAETADESLRRAAETLGHFETLLRHGEMERFARRLETFPADVLPLLNAPAAHKAHADLSAAIDELRGKIAHACDRLEDIRASYTLYRDLVVTTADGFVLANSSPARRAEVLGLRVADEQWFGKALATKNGTEYFAQDLSASVIEPQLSLVYSTAIRENSDENGCPIGTLGVFFDFQGEARIILDEYMPREAEGQVMDGCFSMFANAANHVIASNDEGILRVGETAHIPRRHRNLSDGGKLGSYVVFEGVESAVFSARTDGYLDYKGLGWSSHVVVPKDFVFSASDVRELEGITAEDLMKSRIIPEINKNTYTKVQDDKESIQLISLNGIVFASKLGKRGGSLGPIFNQITKSGDFVTSRMEDLLKEMAVGELALNLKALENLSKQAIDLVDRNLFERSADIRWWATDQYLWTALLNPVRENKDRACQRLKVINGSYTMYRNIVLADASGEIVACSRTELKNELARINVSDQHWFQDGMRTGKFTEYAVQDAVHSPLEKTKERSLIYSGGVRANGAREGDSIGVLGILFDWDTEARKILSACLPKTTGGKSAEGSVAFYANREGVVIEATDPGLVPVGSRIDLGPRIAELEAGASLSEVLEHNGKTYIVGSSKTKGYREYPGLAWTAHVMRPLYA